MTPASRLLAIINSVLAMKGSEGAPASQSWSVTLTLPLDPGEPSTPLLASRLISLCDQVDLLITLLAEAGAPPYLYERHFSNLKEGFSPAMLHDRWGNSKHHFSSEVIVALQWADWTLSGTEAPISAEDLKSIEDLLAALEAAIDSDGVPESLRRMLRKQMDGLRGAINLYPISGIEPLREAAKSAMAEAMIEKDALSKAAQDSGTNGETAVKRFSAVLSKTIEAVNKAAQTSRSVSTLITLGESGLKFLSEP